MNDDYRIALVGLFGVVFGSGISLAGVWYQSLRDARRDWANMYRAQFKEFLRSYRDEDIPALGQAHLHSMMMDAPADTLEMLALLLAAEEDSDLVDKVFEGVMILVRRDIALTWRSRRKEQLSINRLKGQGDWYITASLLAEGRLEPQSDYEVIEEEQRVLFRLLERFAVMKMKIKGP